jgi:hypothetical protein
MNVFCSQLHLAPFFIGRTVPHHRRHQSIMTIGELLLGHYPFIFRVLIARKWNLSRESNWNRCPGSVNNSVSFYFHNANDIVLKPPFNALKKRIGAHFFRPFSEISIFNRVATLMPTFSQAWVLLVPFVVVVNVQQGKRMDKSVNLFPPK